MLKQSKIGKYNFELSCYLIEKFIDIALSSDINPEYIKWLVDEAVKRKNEE